MSHEPRGSSGQTVDIALGGSNLSKMYKKLRVEYGNQFGTEIIEQIMYLTSNDGTPLIVDGERQKRS